MARDGESTYQQQQSATQGATQSQTSNLWSQFESQPIESIVWGRLYGKNIKVKSVGTTNHNSDKINMIFEFKKFVSNLGDLNTESYRAGRGESNDLILTLKDLPEQILCRISKVHFIIQRTNCDLSQPVYIEDLSRNGTFVNSERIGSGRRRILQNNDIISLSHPNYKVFIFKDLSPNEAVGIPSEITCNYYISRKLGSGACGLVRLVYNRRTCEQFAMKIVKKNLLAASTTKANHLNDPNRVLNEARIMKNLSHPCVIKLHDIVDKPDSVYMVLQFMKGGDLLNRIVDNKRLSEQISKLYFYQMCNAVKYLHDKGITHRDLKPDNVLLETTDEATLLKVSDFGLSKFVQKDSVMRTLCGTPLYVAPEVLLTGGRGSYTKKVDIWSLGVVLFTCLSGTLPFSDDYGSPASEQIKRGKFRFNHPSWKKVSQRAVALIKEMLIVDHERRATISDILNSNWLRDTEMLRTANKLMKNGSIDTEDEENFIQPPMKRIRR